MLITRAGNAVGFTADGYTVVVQGRKRAVGGGWRVYDVGPEPECFVRNGRNFQTKGDAQADAASRIDADVTAKLAWW